VAVPEESRRCVECHGDQSPAIVEHWRGSTHAEKGVACVDCHQAEAGDADAFQHEGWRIATIVSPRDCRRCHPGEYEQFTASHHSRAGDILHSLDNFLAETVEGGRASHSAIRLARFDPHSPTPGRTTETVNGLAAAFTGCQQCHGSKLAFQSLDGDVITKSGMMVGLGEEWEEILEVMADLRAVDCNVLTIGQYLRPSARHLPVERYYTPQEFQPACAGHGRQVQRSK